MDNDNQHDSFLGDESSGEGNVGSDNLTLEEINTLLGRNYKDKESALKGMKETYSFVGKAGKVEKELNDVKAKLNDTSAIAEDVKGMKDELFYANNPQYKPFRDTISAMGSNPAEVVEKDAFKKIFTDLSEYERTKNAKSVLVSNPRIGQAKTKLDEARDLQKVGNYQEANRAAVNAVLEAYET